MEITSQQLDTLGEPESYFDGREQSLGDYAKNIIIFHRTKVDQLYSPEQTEFQHHRHVLIYAMSGSGRVLINEESAWLEPGKTCFIFPYELHLYQDVSIDNLSWLFITFDSTAENFPVTLKERCRECSQETEHLLANLIKCWIGKEVGLIHHLALLFLELTRCRATSINLSNEIESETTFQKVNRIMRENPAKPWSLDDIARSAGISAGHLCLLFRKETQLSLGAYMRRFRVTRAAQLLRTTQLNIQGVATRCGFESPYSFSRTFKNEMGLSPLNYRKQSAMPRK